MHLQISFSSKLKATFVKETLKNNQNSLKRSDLNRSDTAPFIHFSMFQKLVFFRAIKLVLLILWQISFQKNRFIGSNFVNFQGNFILIYLDEFFFG